VCAEIDGGTGGERFTRVKLADLAAALGSAAAATPDEGCVFVFAEQDPAGVTRWATAGQLPAAWPQITASAGSPVALTRSPLDPPARAR
jgi:hypothetical protein